MVYEPAPARTPLISRRPAWAGGLSVGALLIAALLSGPILVAGIALFVEIAAVGEPDRP